jgi:hypothetical protein
MYTIAPDAAATLVGRGVDVVGVQVHRYSSFSREGYRSKGKTPRRIPRLKTSVYRG